MIVVFDAGIWISALEFRGVPSQAIEHAAINDRIVMCAGIEDETTRVMEEKFSRSSSNTLKRLKELLGDPVRVSIVGTVSGVCRDPDDDYILECAIRGHADLIVTGDKDLLTLRSYEGVEIVTPRDYLNQAMSGSHDR